MAGFAGSQLKALWVPETVFAQAMAGTLRAGTGQGELPVLPGLGSLTVPAGSPVPVGEGIGDVLGADDLHAVGLDNAYAVLGEHAREVPEGPLLVQIWP